MVLGIFDGERLIEEIRLIGEWVNRLILFLFSEALT
jgi:hypothetical protein